MNELIKVNYENENPTVSARELHEYLDVDTKYADWFPRMCEYGFTKGVDFNPLKIEKVQIEGKRAVTRNVDDAEITIDMAKELCMIQHNIRAKKLVSIFLRLKRSGII